MLKLKDFFHYPQVDHLPEELLADRPGLIVVAGSDPRPARGQSVLPNFMPSGRMAIFRTLADEMLFAGHDLKCVIVTSDPAFIRVPRPDQRRVVKLRVEPPLTYNGRVAEALRLHPAILVIDRLDRETTPLALEAARGGVKVLSSLDTIFSGGSVARQLLDLGISESQLASLTWVLAVQRLPALCPTCRQPASPTPAQIARLEALLRFECDLPAGWGGSHHDDDPPVFYCAGGCAKCQGTGRSGDVAVLDIFRAEEPPPGLFVQPSRSPMMAGVLHLTRHGHVALEDCLQFDADPVHRTYNRLISVEQLLTDSTQVIDGLRAELNAANRVLRQRTQALFSLEELSQAMISSTRLDELAQKVCRRAGELCGADRAILFFQHSADRMKVLAMLGWDEGRVQREVEISRVLDPARPVQLVPHKGRPPGVMPPEGGDQALQAGLSVPLIAQEKLVGLMLVHSVQKNQFSPGEVALLQTFANQAAVALQRAGLVEQLQAKVTALEAAQVELAVKERIERELELARQVQQSMLPRSFPRVAGFSFTAQNQPARQVGGDFYDVFTLDDDHFGLAIADVSDKGMPAALYMALTRSLLLAEARRQLSPRQALTSVNRILQELGEQSMFVTLFYGVVECSTRTLTYARAGHDRPLLLRDQAILELGGSGIALGILTGDDFHLSEERFELAPGDRLVLYTDGLTDVMSPSGQTMGLPQLKSLVQSYAGLPSGGLSEVLFAALSTYRQSAEQYDDMTLLVVDVLAAVL